MLTDKENNCLGLAVDKKLVSSIKWNMRRIRPKRKFSLQIHFKKASPFATLVGSNTNGSVHGNNDDIVRG